MIVAFMVCLPCQSVMVVGVSVVVGAADANPVRCGAAPAAFHPAWGCCIQAGVYLKGWSRRCRSESGAPARAYFPPCPFFGHCSAVGLLASDLLPTEHFLRAPLSESAKCGVKHVTGLALCWVHVSRRSGFIAHGGFTGCRL